MESKGGTEIQVNFLNKYLDLSKYNNINLIVNQAAFKRIINGKKIYYGATIILINLQYNY